MHHLINTSVNEPISQSITREEEAVLSLTSSEPLSGLTVKEEADDVRSLIILMFDTIYTHTEIILIQFLTFTLVLIYNDITVTSVQRLP